MAIWAQSDKRFGGVMVIKKLSEKFLEPEHKERDISDTAQLDSKGFDFGIETLGRR